MNKPIYLLPCIYVYKVIVFALKVILTFIKYINVGLFITLMGLINVIVTTIFYFLKYIFIGFIILCYTCYRFLRYVGFGIAYPIIAINRSIKVIQKINDKRRQEQQAEQERRAIARERNRQIEEENRKRLAEIKEKEKETIEEKKRAAKEAKSKKTEVYINENVVIEKKGISDYLNAFFASIGQIPNKIKSLFSNNMYAKNARNKKDINREALLLDFNGEDAEKSEHKIMYRYEAVDADGKKVVDYFPAYSKVEVHSFLLSEGYQVYKIETNKWIQALYGDGSYSSNRKIRTRDLIFFTTQLSTYVKAGIPLVDALRILSRQFKNRTYTRIFKSMIYDLTMGDSFSDAMSKQGEAFPRLLINMVKASEMTGELPEALDDMADYFTETDKTRKQMITAMTYPTIIFVVAVAAVAFIMVWVVPQFVGIYEGIDGATLPDITVFVLNASQFLQTKGLWVLLGVVIFIIIFYYLFKNVKVFKSAVQFSLMHLPVIGNVIIYNEVTLFTKTFASLLAHNVFITDSMEILNKITNNEVYKMLIMETITNLAKGERISLAFKDNWAFPTPAYEMITTGERTGQLPEMMNKVAKYYQELHRNAVTRIKTFVEPILILFLTGVVGAIVLSIVVPMFSIYGSLGM